MAEPQAGARDRHDTPSGGSPPPEGYSDLFRAEALQSLLDGPARHGELLRISPAWTRWTYDLLVVVFVAAVLFSLFARVSEYAEGPAVVRIEGRVDLSAATGGTVTEVDVEPGTPVDAGRVLVRFYHAQEGAELDRIVEEFELQLVAYLRSPADAGVRQSLIALRTQKEFAERRLQERTVRAPRTGLVGDVHVRPGQLVAAGDTLLALIEDPSKISLIAMLPGHYRPLLEVGMPLRLELSGYRYAYQVVPIGSIADEVIGPQAVRRQLGPEVADAIALTGPVVLVRAELPAATFAAGRDSYVLHDGMQGRAEVKVRSERVLQALVPGLGALFEGPDG